MRCRLVLVHALAGAVALQLPVSRAAALQLPASRAAARPARARSAVTLQLEASLSPLQRVRRAASFYSQVVPILGAYKAVELFSNGTEAEKEARYQALHEWGSERLERTIQDLKGFYVKTGQVISTRVDLFPEQYTSRLASLQDDLDPLPAQVIKGVVVEELLLGELLESIFATFDDEPLGSASIAQVH